MICTLTAGWQKCSVEPGISFIAHANKFSPPRQRPGAGPGQVHRGDAAVVTNDYVDAALCALFFLAVAMSSTARWIVAPLATRPCRARDGRRRPA